MQAQRRRILKMLENGSISMDEALTLLENLQSGDGKEDEAVELTEHPKNEVQLTPQTEDDTEKTRERSEEEKSSTEQTHSSKKEEPSVDEFLDDLRRDFTAAGDRFMQFMQTAVEKVKDMDLESPFGKSFVFTHTVTEEASEIEELSFTIPSGKVTVHPSTEKEIRAEMTVKSYHKESKEEAEKEVLEKIQSTNENGIFTIASDVKVGLVDIDLYVPQKTYKKFEVHLTNGALKARGLTAERIQVKTTNGAIQLNEVTSEEVEVETLNGRVYLDGDLKEVDAQSLNGPVVVTTTNEEAKKIKAKTVSGSVELYIPSTVSLTGEVSTNIGKLDLGLNDVERTTDQDQLFQRTIRFYKEVPEQSTRLYLTGKAKTGTVLVRYNI